MRQARTHERKGEAAEARKAYEAILSAYPGNQRAKAAIEALASPQAVSDRNAPPKDKVNALIGLYQGGQLATAKNAADELVRQYPASFVVWNILGGVEKGLGRLAEAEAAFAKACALNPGFAGAHNNLGVTLQDQGKLAEAIARFEKTLQLQPGHAAAANNLGNALKDAGRLGEAEKSLRAAIAIKPDYAEAHGNLGVVCRLQGRLADAIDCFRKALELKPDHAETLSNLGSAYQDRGELDRAVEAFGRAIAIRPDMAEAHTNLGIVLQERNELDRAVASYGKALEISPGYAPALSQMLFQKAFMCDWSWVAEFEAVRTTLGISGERIAPFTTIAFDEDPGRQRQRSANWAAKTYRQVPLPLPARPAARPQRLKIGYFSADFHDHATLYLMAGLLRCHDKDRFEICAYSYGAGEGGAMRERVAAQADRFADIRAMPDGEVAELARRAGLDIAIDLKGYTQHGRSELFAWRLAPVQISYLGYPGTMAADFIDYLVADPVLIPEAERRHYSESIVYLPNSYQPNDDRRAIAATRTGRADFGLPEEGFVFCCFNNNYKIGPREFDIWMRLLERVEDSVLWLLRSNRWAEANLRREAAARGIDPARLVFADRLPQGEHLARHAHADLFLDTFVCHAHTTASDALWVGLPVITRPVRQFAGRVAASLLNAAGLPELIADTDEGYEALALRFATDAEALSGARAKLAANQGAAPLFDTARYTRDFEAALDAVFQRHVEGLAPADLHVGS